MDEKLTDASRNATYHRAVRIAAGQAKIAMNKYYSLTDAADAYRIVIRAWFLLHFFIYFFVADACWPAVLHPCLKQRYMQQLKWPTVWQDEAIRITREIWELNYASVKPAHPEPVEQSQNTVCCLSNPRAAVVNTFFSQPARTSSTTSWPPLLTKTVYPTQTTSYLATSTHRDIVPRSASSSAHSIGGSSMHTPTHVYPEWPLTTWPHQVCLTLSLCVPVWLTLSPASSTDIERIFSRGRDLLDYRRNRLTAESMRALLCLRDWIRNGIIAIDEITEFLAAKSSGVVSESESEDEADVEPLYDDQ